jgi:hypothetical protein
MALTTRQFRDFVQSILPSAAVFYDTLPPNPVALVFVSASGGIANHDVIGYDTQLFQVRTRGETNDEAEDLARQAYKALNGLREQSVDGVRIRYVVAEQPPFSMGHDKNGNVEWAFNVRLRAFEEV